MKSRLTLSLAACLTQWASVHAQIEPVDGRLSTWNGDWQRLENTVERPKGSDLVALLTYTPFENVRLVVISLAEDKNIHAYVAQSKTKAFLPGNAETPKATGKTCQFDKEMARRINALWTAILRSVRYSDATGRSRIMDGSSCYAGGTDLTRPYHFLMGQFMLNSSSALEAIWMKETSDAIVAFVNANTADERRKAMERIDALVRQREANPK